MSVTLNAALALAIAVIGARWWAYWVFPASGIVLAAHYLVYKSLTVDDRWAEERADDLNLTSYDRGHIESIRKRIKEYVRPRDHR